MRKILLLILFICATILFTSKTADVITSKTADIKFVDVIALKPLGKTADNKTICSLDPFQQQIISYDSTKQLGICMFSFVGLELEKTLRSAVYRCSGTQSDTILNPGLPVKSGLWVWIWLPFGCHDNGPIRYNGLGRTDSFWNDKYVLDATNSDSHFGGYSINRPVARKHARILVFAARSMYRKFQHFILDSAAWLLAGKVALTSYKPWDYILPRPDAIETKLLETLQLPTQPESYVDGLVCSEKGIFVPLQLRQFFNAPESFDIVNRQFLLRPILQNQPPSVIFFPRGSYGRKPINENDVLMVLRDFIKDFRKDLRIVEFHSSAYSVQETLDLMRSAVLFVGAHGGALANIIMANENATVIEICGYEKPNSEIWKSYWYYGWLRLQHICIKKFADGVNAKVDLDDFRAALSLWHSKQIPKRCYSVFDETKAEILVNVDWPYALDHRKWTPFNLPN